MKALLTALALVASTSTAYAGPDWHHPGIAGCAIVAAFVPGTVCK